MDSEAYKIYVDRLHSGNVEPIREIFDPAFLEQNTEELAYTKNIEVNGEAYVAENELIIHLDIHTVASVPCKICNQPIEIPVDLRGVYLVESLDNVKSGVFNFKELLREAILLEAPQFTECSNGKCPERDTITNFLSSSSDGEKKEGSSGDEGYHPFANLKL